MGTADGNAELEPIIRPRLVRFLKDRERLVDFGMREEFFDELERQLSHRRRPDVVAESATDTTLERMREATKPVARQRVKDRMEKANSGLLKNL